jgi:hypothetical protein
VSALPGSCHGSRAGAVMCRPRAGGREIDAAAMRVGYTAPRVAGMPKLVHLALLEPKLGIPAGEAGTPGVGVILGDFYGCPVSVLRIQGLGYIEGAQRGAEAKGADAGPVSPAPPRLHDPTAA